MNAKLAVTAAVSLLAGLGLGFLLFSSELPPAQAPEPRPSPAPAASPAATAPSLPTPVAAPVPVVAAPPPTTPVAAPPAPPIPVAPEVEPVVVALTEKVQDLERQLAIERAMRKGTEGEQLAPPPNLAPRFRDEKLLLDTFNRALKQAGFPGQVSNIDCTEHPCIVFGTGFGDRGDMEKLKGQLGPYENDSFSTYGFGTGDGKKEHRFFGVAVMPETKGPPDEAVQKRIGFRVNQMHEASKPPPTPKP